MESNRYPNLNTNLDLKEGILQKKICANRFQVFLHVLFAFHFKYVFWLFSNNKVSNHYTSQLYPQGCFQLNSNPLRWFFYNFAMKFAFSFVSCTKIAFEKNDIMYLLAHTYSCVHLASYARGYGNAGCGVFKRGKQN